MIRSLLLAFALLGVAGCATDEAALDAHGVCPLIQLAETPVEIRNNLLFVQVTIQGVPVTLLVDTGAERTLLTESVVEKLGLPRDTQHATRTFGIGSPTASWDASLPNGLILGGVQFPIDTVTVGHFAIDQIAGGKADGLLGADLLLAFDLDLNLPAHRLSLYRAHRGCHEAGPPWHEPYVGVAGVAARRDRLLVPFVLDGVAGMGVLDTGAQLSSVSLRMAERTGIEEEELAGDRLVMAHGAAPDHVAVRIHRFRELRVGPAVMHDPSLPVVPMSDSMGDALVGADFLQGRRAWLSSATHQVFVTRLEPGPTIAATGAEKDDGPQ